MKEFNHRSMALHWLRLRALMYTLRRLFDNLIRDFMAHGCQKSAAALTYMTLFAIVPLMTVMYSVFSVVPAFDGVAERLQIMIFSNFIPETSQSIQDYLATFSAQARSLTAAGVAMLLVTAYLMLVNIEGTFNAIWGVGKPRRGLSSFLLYWAVLSIGPLLLGVGLATSTYVLSLKLMMTGDETFGMLGKALYRLLPLVTTSAAFTLLFVAVPNCRVPFKYAAIGGVTTAVLFEALKVGFAAMVANSSFQLIYGAFAAVPLFLLWVNLVWTIILAGAILVRTLAERSYLITEGKVTDTVAALKCLALFHSRAQQGGKVSDADCYARGLGVVHWQQLRARLIKHNWIAVTTSGRYVLCRDLRKVTVWDLAIMMQLQISDLAVTIAHPSREPWFEAYLKMRADLLDHSQHVMNISLEDFFQGLTGEEAQRLPDAAEPSASIRKMS